MMLSVFNKFHYLSTLFILYYHFLCIAHTNIIIVVIYYILIYLANAFIYAKIYENSQFLLFAIVLLCLLAAKWGTCKRKFNCISNRFLFLETAWLFSPCLESAACRLLLHSFNQTMAYYSKKKKLVQKLFIIYLIL